MSPSFPHNGAGDLFVQGGVKMKLIKAIRPGLACLALAALLPLQAQAGGEVTAEVLVKY